MHTSANTHMYTRNAHAQVRWSHGAKYELSEDLCQPLARLRSALHELKASLHPSLLSNVWRQVCLSVCLYFA